MNVSLMSVSAMVMVQTLIALTPMGAMSAAVPMAIDLMIPSAKVSVVYVVYLQVEKIKQFGGGGGRGGYLVTT